MARRRMAEPMMPAAKVFLLLALLFGAGRAAAGPTPVNDFGTCIRLGFQQVALHQRCMGMREVCESFVAEKAPRVPVRGQRHPIYLYEECIDFTGEACEKSRLLDEEFAAACPRMWRRGQERNHASR